MTIDLDRTINSFLEKNNISIDINPSKLLEEAQDYISELEIDEKAEDVLLNLFNQLEKTVDFDKIDLDNLSSKVNNFIKNNDFFFEDLIDLLPRPITKPVEEKPSKNEVFSKLYVFGDSLSDPGNVFNATQFIQPFQELFGLDIPVIPPSPPYFEGRFTNGLTWAGNLAADLDLNLTPSTELSVLSPDLPIASPVTITDDTLTVSPFFNGATTTQSVNFAFGGAQLGEVGAGEFGDAIPGVSTQVEFFIDDHQQANQFADPDALYVIWGGANDYQTVADAQPESVVDDLATAVEDLYEIGARNFLIADLPDLGKTPRALSDDAPVVSETLTNITNQHNSLLSEAIANLDDSLADINLIPLEVNQLFEDILANPSDFGITNTSEPFLNPDTLAPADDNPDEYIFWDLIHPTATVHEAVGDLATETLLSAQDGLKVSGTSTQDELTGKSVKELLAGGQEDDLINGDAAKDTILDFQIGEGSLLPGGLTFGELSLAAGEDRTVIDLGNIAEAVAVLPGIDANDLSSEDIAVM